MKLTREQKIQWARDSGAGFACETLLANGKDADDLVCRLIDIAYAAGQASKVPDVDWLANVIRAVDGYHSLGAGALAEKLVDAISNTIN